LANEENKVRQSCMFQDKICSKWCKGWDYEASDCRIFQGIWGIRRELIVISDKLSELDKTIWKKPQGY